MILFFRWVSFPRGTRVSGWFLAVVGETGFMVKNRFPSSIVFAQFSELVGPPPQNHALCLSEVGNLRRIPAPDILIMVGHGGWVDFLGEFGLVVHLSPISPLSLFFSPSPLSHLWYFLSLAPPRHLFWELDIILAMLDLVFFRGVGGQGYALWGHWEGPPHIRPLSPFGGHVPSRIM